MTRDQKRPMTTIQTTLSTISIVIMSLATASSSWAQVDQFSSFECQSDAHERQAILDRPIPPVDCRVYPELCQISASQRERGVRANTRGYFAWCDGDSPEALKWFKLAKKLLPGVPLILVNLMYTYRDLQDFKNAYGHAEEVLAFDVDKLGPLYEEVVEVRDQLLTHLATLDIECFEPTTSALSASDAAPGESSATMPVRVQLDGNPQLLRRGRVRLRIRPGNHALIAEKKSYLTASVALAAFPRQHIRARCSMLANVDAVRTVHRWDTWIPRWLAGIGASVGILGGVMLWRGNENNRQYREAFQVACLAPQGCFAADYPAQLNTFKSRSVWYRGFGIGATIIGGTALAVGLVGLYLNQGKQTPVAHDAWTIQVITDAHHNGVSVTTAF